MRKYIRNIFIPNKDNHYQSYGLSFRTLTFYLIILIILQIGVNFIIEPRTTQKAYASAEISSSEIVALTNAARTSNGLSPLSTDGRLNTAAYNKCVDMFANQYWDHVSPNGTPPWYFISQAGYTYVYAGENLAKGFSSSSEIVNAWMNSPSHRANILSSSYQDTGTAIMTGNLQGVRTTLCVQMFGSQGTTPAPVEAAPSEPSYQPPLGEPSSQASPEQKILQTPEITKPKDGEIISNNRPTVSGKAAKETQVLIYDISDQIGSQTVEPQSLFVFKPSENLKEGEHKISAESVYKDGTKSPRSKTTNFTIDTIPPEIKENTLSADLFVRGTVENYKVAVQVNNNPKEVTASVDHYALILNRDKKEIDLYEGTLIPPPETLTENPRKLTIVANDKVGNKASYLITIPKPTTTQQGTLQKIGETIRSLLPRDFQNIARLIYFIFGFWIFILLMIDGVVVYRRGIVRIDSHSRAHLAIIFLMLVGILFASLGNII